MLILFFLLGWKCCKKVFFSETPSTFFINKYSVIERWSCRKRKTSSSSLLNSLLESNHRDNSDATEKARTGFSVHIY